MGEIADMMLDGTLCEGCGTYIDDEGGGGFPRYCSNQCARDRGALHALPNPTTTKPNPNKVNCPVCRKRVKRTGLADHQRDAHQQEKAMSRQFIACTFKPGDTKSYTYHNDGEPLAVGDVAKVADNRSEGWKRVYVVAIGVEEPTKFPTKPILGKAEPEPVAARDALDLGDDADFEAWHRDRF